MIYLTDIFQGLCDYLNEKLRWTEARSRFTKAVFDYFSDLLEANYRHRSLKEERNYLTIDYIWRYETSSKHYIVLAIEHENKSDVDEFLNKEVQHLIDIEAENKIAITYPPLGEEGELIEKVREKIRRCGKKLRTLEDYLIVFGFSTSKKVNGKRRRAILFKGYRIDSTGGIKNRYERVILQTPRRKGAPSTSNKVSVIIKTKG